MNPISTLVTFPKLQETTARSFREDLINKFIEEINREREGTKWKPVSKRAIALKLNTNPFLKQSWQIESFYKQCKNAKSFSKCFFGSLKTNIK